MSGLNQIQNISKIFIGKPVLAFIGLSVNYLKQLT